MSIKLSCGFKCRLNSKPNKKVNANCSSKLGSSVLHRFCHSQKVRALAAAKAADPGRILVAIQAELIPFALGYSDPVRDRVQARQREAAGD